MSRESGTVPSGGGNQARQSQRATGPDKGVVPHPYNLRPKRRTIRATNPKGVLVGSVVAPGAGEEADHRRVGGRDILAEADVDEGDSGPGASGGDLSDDQSERYALRSEASDNWADSRSRVTTPELSTPASPRRRPSVEELASPRLQEPTLSALPDARMHPQGERARAAQGHRQSSPPFREDEDPTELEARSSRLIAQLQKCIQEHEQALQSPANESLTCGNRPVLGEAVAGKGGRHGPQASQPFGTRATRPGRCDAGATPAETMYAFGGHRAREEADSIGKRAGRHFSDR